MVFSKRTRLAAALTGFVFASGVSTDVRVLDCSLVETGQVPLSDLAGTYRGVEGGLYPNGMTIRPALHESVGLDLAQNHIRPLDATGAPSAAGRIGLVSLGMSNTSTEFGQFLELIRNESALNPRLVVVNGAMSSQTADRWRDPNSPSWQWMFSQLAQRQITAQQVQVAWVKVVLAGFGTNTQNPLDNFPAFPQALQADLETISRNLKTNFPNIRIVYFSSRIRAYTTPRGLSPEPTAYETGFAVRWAIARQIGGAPELGPSVAPWMSWGPYLWADGMAPRSDGLTYSCADLEADFTHPSPSGSRKVAEQLRAFFLSDPTATPWFLKAASGPPRIDSMTASPPGGLPGVRVSFAAAASDPDGVREYVWTFGDGTYAYGPTPGKTFNVPGRYPVHLTVLDNLGNASQLTTIVAVGDTSELPGAPRNFRVTRPPGGP
jgi:hypothetical protein